LTTLGPGATNAVTGVAHAFLDRTPVIVMTGQTSERLISRHTHQVVDLEALFKPITKATIALKPRDTAATLRKAIGLAAWARPGPVNIRISSDDAARGIEAPDEVVTMQGQPWSPTEVLPEAELDEACKLFSQSKRPVIVAGLGLEPERPYSELRRLAETSQTPVIVTPKAKGAVPDDHPLFAGTIGLTRTDPVYEVLEEADFVLLVGLDVVELVKPWQHASPTVWLAPWTNHDPVLPAEVAIVAPMRTVLERLAEIHVSIEEDWGTKRVSSHRRNQRVVGSSSGTLTPQSVLHVLRDNLPPGAFLTTDVGSHKIFYSLEWPSFLPNRFLVSNGLSSMGYGLPAAIAVSLFQNTDPVVCTTGDAGLVMNLGELNTLARLNAPVTVVVFKDNALDLIRSHQNRAGKPTFGTEFAAPDFVGIAEAHGIRAFRARDEETLAETLRQSVNSKRPRLIEVEIDPSTYPTTPQG
jgi:acetolactate synthase-1/2/3 large subunit